MNCMSLCNSQHGQCLYMRLMSEIIIDIIKNWTQQLSHSLGAI